MGKNLHPINSAPSNSKTEVPITCMSIVRIFRISMGLDCRPIILESCNVSPFAVGPRAARPANFFFAASKLFVAEGAASSVKKADSSTFLLNAARSIYWRGAIFDRQEAGTCGIFWFLWQPCFM